jgi:hypothetical protein
MRLRTLDDLLPALGTLLLLSLIACTCGGDEHSTPTADTSQNNPPAKTSQDAPAPADADKKNDGWSIKGGLKIGAVEPLGAAGRQANIEAAFKKLYEDKGVVVRAATCDATAATADTFPCTLDQAHGPQLKLDGALTGDQLTFKPAGEQPAALALDELNKVIPEKIKADTLRDATANCGVGVAFFPVGASFTCGLQLKSGPAQQVKVVVKDAEGNISWHTESPAPAAKP